MLNLQNDDYKLILAGLYLLHEFANDKLSITDKQFRELKFLHNDPGSCGYKISMIDEAITQELSK